MKTFFIALGPRGATWNETWLATHHEVKDGYLYLYVEELAVAVFRPGLWNAIREAGYRIKPPALD